MLRRLNLHDNENHSERGFGSRSQFPEEISDTSMSSESSFSDDLDAFLDSSLPRASRNAPVSFNLIIKKEMTLFQATNNRPKNLENLYQSLLTIRPSSVEAERAFSALGLFSTRLRTRLSDDCLDGLVFMRQHYMQQSNDV